MSEFEQVKGQVSLRDPGVDLTGWKRPMPTHIRKNFRWTMFVTLLNEPVYTFVGSSLKKSVQVSGIIRKDYLENSGWNLCLWFSACPTSSVTFCGLW